MVLNQDFREFIQSLNEHSVRYLVVGGYAVAFHGHPRYTKDIDIWFGRDPGNAARLVQAIQYFGFGSLKLKEEDFLVPDQMIQLGYPPNRINIFNALPGVEFDPCYSSRIEIEVDGTRVNFINLENLKINKLALRRHQDLADLENLQ